MEDGIGGEKRGQVAVVVEVGIVHWKIVFHCAHEEGIHALLPGRTGSSGSARCGGRGDTRN